MALSYATAVRGFHRTGRFRVVRTANSATGSETTATIVAGAGNMTPIGGYTDATFSGNTWTATIIDGGASTYQNTLLIGA